MAKITARLSDPYHPNGQTVRGGVVWTREWQTVDLDGDALASVESDVNLELGGAPKAAKAAPKAAGFAEHAALVAEARALGIPAKGKNAVLKAAIEAAKEGR